MKAASFDARRILGRSELSDSIRSCSRLFANSGELAIGHRAKGALGPILLPHREVRSWHASRSIRSYFRFGTLTTFGDGDITPAHPLVKTAAYLEAVTGQLYIAVLIASLVGRRAGRSE